MKLLLFILLGLAPGFSQVSEDSIELPAFSDLTILKEITPEKRTQILEIRLNNGKLSAEDVQTLKMFKNVKFLEIGSSPEGCEIPPKSLAEIGELPNLKELKICISKIKKEHFSAMTSFKSLTKLSIQKHYYDDVSFGNEALSFIGKMKKLEKLTLWNFPINNESLDHLKKSSITSLVLASRGLTKKMSADLFASGNFSELVLISPYLKKAEMRAYSTHSQALINEE